MTGLVCVAAGPGAPGATTVALAAALTAECGSALLVDADGDGGSLAAHLGAATTPGLVTLAAATRHSYSGSELKRHIQPVTGEVGLLAAPSNPEQVSAALIALGRPFAESLTAHTAVADVGRWRPDNPAECLVGVADATVLAVRPTLAGVASARWSYRDLSARCAHVVVATRGERPYGPDEVAAAVGCPPSDVVVLPVDRAGASLITNSVSSRWLRRAALACTIRAMALELWPVASDDGVLV